MMADTVDKKTKPITDCRILASKNAVPSEMWNPANLFTSSSSLELNVRRVMEATRKPEKMRRIVAVDGRRLAAVRAAEKVGFWYTENLDLGNAAGLLPPSMASRGERELETFKNYRLKALLFIGFLVSNPIARA